MRLLACAIGLVVALSVAAVAAEPTKVSVSASDELLSAVAAKLGKDAGVSVIVDPKADTKLNISLGEAELPKILDSLSKVTKLTWKKVQFAKPAESQVTLEQIKSSIVALASMPLVAASVQDGSGKGAAMFARELPATPEAPSVTLPDGYAWATVYVIYDPAQASPETASKPAPKSQASETNSKRFAELANMSSNDRRKAFANEVMDMMTLTPDARKEVIQDQFSAIRDLDPKVRDQYLKDMRGALGGMFSGQRNQGNQGNRNNNRNNNNARPQRGVVIPAR